MLLSSLLFITCLGIFHCCKLFGIPTLSYTAQYEIMTHSLRCLIHSWANLHVFLMFPINYYCVCMCGGVGAWYVYVGMCTMACVCRAEDNFVELVSPSTFVWVLRIKLRSLGLLSKHFTQGAFSPAQDLPVFKQQKSWELNYFIPETPAHLAGPLPFYDSHGLWECNPPFLFFS